MSTGRPRSTNRRRWRAGLVALLLLAFAYPIGANLVLAAGGVQKMFEDTDSVKVDFRRAWTFWPGRVHVDDLRVTMQDRNVQFELTMPSVDVTVSLRELAERRFHATRVRGTGVVFRFRHRIEPEAAGLPFIGALPPVSGFSDPPLREAGPPTPPLDEEHYDLWMVHIEDVDVDVREVWAQMFRYQGAGRALGAFRLRPAKRLWVGPAELRLESGTVASGPHEVASAIRGSVTCKVDDFDVERVHGMEPFRFISTRTKLELAVRDLAVIDFLAGPGAGVVLEDGSGTADVDVGLDHGVFTSASRLVYRTSHVGVATAAARFQIDGELAMSATGPTVETPLRMSLDVPSARIRFEGARAAPIAVRDASAVVASSSADVTVPWSLAGPKVELRVVLPELRSLGDWPGARSLPLRARRGRGEAQVALERREQGAFEGTLAARAEEVAICHESGVCFESPRIELSADGATRAAGKPRARFRVEASDVKGERGASQFFAASLAGHGTMSHAGVSANLDVKKVRIGPIFGCPWTKADAIAIAGRVLTPARGPIAADVEGRVERASFTWGSFGLAAPRVAFSGSWEGGRLSAEVRAGPLDLRSSGGAPKGWHAAVGSTLVRASLKVSDDGVRGPARVEARRVVGRVGKTNLEGDLLAALDVTSKDRSYATGDLSGVVQARRVALRAGPNEVRDYWAEVELRSMHVDTRQNLDLAGVMKARFRDALPAVYVLASEEDIPSWVPQLLPRHTLALDLRLERFCRWTDVQLVEARHGPLRASGRVQAQPGETRGALLFQLADFTPLSLGVDFAETYGHGSPFAGSGWLEEHLESLTRAATAKHDEQCRPEPPSCN